MGNQWMTKTFQTQYFQWESIEQRTNKDIPIERLGQQYKNMLIHDNWGGKGGEREIRLRLTITIYRERPKERKKQ